VADTFGHLNEVNLSVQGSAVTIMDDKLQASRFQNPCLAFWRL